MNTKDMSFKIHDGSGVSEVVVKANAGDLDKELKGVDMSQSQGVMKVNGRAGEVKQLGTVQVQTQENSQLAITTSWGSRATLADALQSPSTHFVQIGSTRTTVEAAQKGGLINLDGAKIDAVPMPQQIPNEVKQPTFDSPIIS